MRTVIAVFLVLTLLAAPAFSEFDEPFFYPDGSFPDGWVSTGDSSGGGAFEIRSNAFTHSSTGHVHYYRDAGVEGVGEYMLAVRDMCWDFAWRISPSNPQSGQCLRLRHTCEWGPWCVVLSRMEWETLDAAQCPDGGYMWHNGTESILHQEWLGGDAMVGLHEIIIRDYGLWLEVWLPGYVPFTADHFLPDEGYVGLGCGQVVSGVPSFEYLVCYDFMPVEQNSWGAIKALYR